MTTQSGYEPAITRTDGLGIQRIFLFANGYGASLRTFTPGLLRGISELAVLKVYADGEFDVCYDTPITDDVIQGITPDNIDGLLRQIDELPTWLPAVTA